MITVEAYDKKKHGPVDDADFVVTVPFLNNANYDLAEYVLAEEVAEKISYSGEYVQYGCIEDFTMQFITIH
jgi:hypothetical protein